MDHHRPLRPRPRRLLGLLQGFIVAYGGVPSFIVTLGGLLVWRGLIFQYAQGQTLAPMDPTFRLLGGGPPGSIGEMAELGRRHHRVSSASSTR